MILISADLQINCANIIGKVKRSPTSGVRDNLDTLILNRPLYALYKLFIKFMKTINEMQNTKP